MPANSLTNESIRELMEVKGPCVTLVCKSGADLTKSLNMLRRTLDASGGNSDELLGPVPAAVAELPGPAKGAGQIAIFRSPSTLLASHVGEDVQPVASVGERFHLRTLLSAVGAQRRFYILALSQNRTRLLACTQDRSEEVGLPKGTPVSLEESRQTRKPDHVLNNMNTAGPSSGSMKGVISGTSSDHDDKDEFMLHFFRELDRGVNDLLKQSTDPLVVAGVEHEIALYRKVNNYRRLAEPGVHGAPDGLEGGEMHKRALELLRSNALDPVVELLRDFDKKVGTGHASVHIQEIVAAAYEGRVSHLYLQSDAHYVGTYDAVRQQVKHKDGPLDGAADLLDGAAEQTLSHGGEVRVLNGSSMPNGVAVCALFRYAAAPPVAPEDEEAA